MDKGRIKCLCKVICGGKRPEGIGRKTYQMATWFFKYNISEKRMVIHFSVWSKKHRTKSHHQISLRQRFKWGSGGGRVELHFEELKHWSGRSVEAVWRIVNGTGGTSSGTLFRSAIFCPSCGKGLWSSFQPVVFFR